MCGFVLRKTVRAFNNYANKVAIRWNERYDVAPRL
jgi:hypothetical protein